MASRIPIAVLEYVVVFRAQIAIRFAIPGLRHLQSHGEYQTSRAQIALSAIINDDVTIAVIREMDMSSITLAYSEHMIYCVDSPQT